MLRVRTWLAAATGVALWAAAAPAALPPAPTQLQASPGNASVGLVWTAPADMTVTGYVVYGNTTPVAEVAAPATSYLARSLANGQAYTYTVSAKNPGGEGPASAPVSVYPAVLPQAPAALAAAAQALPVPQVQLSWTPVPAETFPLSGYAVYRSVSGEAQAPYAFAPGPAYVDTGVTTLNAFEDYFYQVAAVDQKGNLGTFAGPAHANLSPPGALGAPFGLSATAQDGQLTLLWDLVSGADGYQINLVRASTAVETIFFTNNPPYIIPLPNNGETYWVSVAALSGGALSSRTQIQTNTLAPAVTGLNVFAGNGYFQLSWNPAPPASGVTGYNIYADAVDGSTFLTSVPASQTLFIPPTTILNFFGVRSVIQSVAGLAGQTVTAAALGGTALPAPPTGLTAALGNSRALALSWNPNYFNDNPSAYRLHALDGPFTTWDIPVSAGTNTLVANLTNGQNYRFFLTALNANGESAASVTITASPLAPPVNFSAQVQGNAVLLSWNEGDHPSGVAAYQLFTSTNGGFSMTFLTATAQTGYTAAPLANGFYSFGLSAANALGETLPPAFLATVTATVNQPPAPPLPIKLTAGNSQIQILWHSVPNANSYNLYRTTVPGFYGGPIQTNLPPKSTFYVDGSQAPALTNTQSYFYTMTAVNDAGESTRSAEYTAIPYKPCALPVNSAVRTTQVRRSIGLAWDASVPGDYPVVGYNIFRSQDGGSSFRWLGGSGIPPVTVPVPAGSSATALAYLDLDINYGITYEYRVQALDYDSLHQISHDGPAYLLARVPVDFPNNRLDVWRNAFNPAKGETVPVTLSEVQPGHTWVKIYNLAGEHIRTLWEGNVDGQYNPDYPFLLNLAWDGKNSRGETVASGVYIIHVEGQSHYHQTRKVAVIK